jgi:hypothetical protein
MRRGVIYASGSYHSTSIDGYQLSIAYLLVKDKYIYNKGNIWKGITMQPITIIQESFT